MMKDNVSRGVLISTGQNGYYQKYDRVGYMWKLDIGEHVDGGSDTLTNHEMAFELEKRINTGWSIIIYDSESEIFFCELNT